MKTDGDTPVINGWLALTLHRTLTHRRLYLATSRQASSLLGLMLFLGWFKVLTYWPVFLLLVTF